MFESQLVNPSKWRVYPGFHESCGPLGELLLDYAKKEWNHQEHLGETPLQIIIEITQHGKLATEAIDKVTLKVTKDKEEFLRLKNDIYCYDAFANFFSEKVKAAMLILRYSYSNDIKDLKKRLSPILRFGFLISPAIKVTLFHASLLNIEPTMDAAIAPKMATPNSGVVLPSVAIVFISQACSQLAFQILAFEANKKNNFTFKILPESSGFLIGSNLV